MININDICPSIYKTKIEMNKNTVLGYATLIMIIMGVLLVCLAVYRYRDVAGYGFGAVGLGFFAIAWVFNALKGRV
ncbi:MAG: hypothetical protein KGV59_04980 [Tenacibaculum sp.]|nr:hypothetical protein [Tenacibaculum sp.]